MFFALISLAIATVEEHVAHQGYYPTELEQEILHATDQVWQYAREHHPRLMPTVDIDGWPIEAADW